MRNEEIVNLSDSNDVMSAVTGALFQRDQHIKELKKRIEDLEQELNDMYDNQ